MKHKPTKIKKGYLISSLLILILGFFLTVIVVYRKHSPNDSENENDGIKPTTKTTNDCV